MLRGLSDTEIAALYWHWDFWARPDQMPPEGDWSSWMMLGGDDFAAGNVPLGEAREAYRLTLSADDAVVAQWQSEVSETLLTAQQRTNYHNRHNNSQNWQLAIQQINDRGEAGAPCHLSLPINEAF